MDDLHFTSRIESFFSHRLPPSSRVLLSPVTCDQVVYALLAAGMTPVFGPVNPATGNLDSREVREEHWSSLDAVLTTNLYGVPDDMEFLRLAAEAHDIVLIEDACHAFDSSLCGQRIGSFGACAVFSLAKHLGGAGGILLFRDESDRTALKKMMHEGLGIPLLNRVKSFAQRVRSRLFGSSKSAHPMVGHRTVFDRNTLDQAIQNAPNIKAFDSFLGSDGSSYRCLPLMKEQASTLAALEGWETEGRRRRECVRKFRKSGMVSMDVALPDDSTLLRIPLFVENREQNIARLVSEGIRVSLVYDPPLHVHFSWLPSIGGEWTPARSRWCDRVLPIAPDQLAKFAQAKEMSAYL